MPEFLTTFFSAEGFMPHGHCYLWTPSLLWTYVVSDTLIGIAYYSIPIALMYFVRKRSDQHFSWIFILFSAFIFACGTTHFMAVWTIWNPNYWPDALLKAITAAVSVVTAVLLWPLIPQALRIPSTRELNRVLVERENEIDERKRIEAALERTKDSLEQRVAERTVDLQEAERKLVTALEQERAARAEAERLNRMKDEFLLTLSHELRTPLNAIFGWTQLLQQRTEDPVMVAKGIEVIDRNVRAQTKLIEDLLDVSAIISGKIRLDLQTIDLPTVINAAMTSITPAAQAKDIQLEKIVDGSINSFRGDANRLQQVLWNLLTNAVKFTPRGGRITVELARIESHIELRVTDTGEGMTPDFLPLMFERFSQADSSTRRRHGGLGIGLSVVKSLVEMHGGSVRATSAGEGKGTTMVVMLPLQAIQIGTGNKHHTLQPLDSLPLLSGVRVLIVDDEADARDMIKIMLDSREAVTASADSAQEAIDLLEVFRPDVVISDIGMPNEDGYDLMRTMRERGFNIPAIALTAFARSEDRVRSIRAGYRAHLVKPVEPFELVKAIADLIKVD